MTAKEAVSKFNLPINSSTVPIYGSALLLLVSGVGLYFDVRSRLDRHEQFTIDRAEHDARIEAKLDKCAETFIDLRMNDKHQDYRLGTIEAWKDQFSYPKSRASDKNTASTEFMP